MPHYQIRGEVPKKRHIVFEKPNGDLYSEEVVSAEGFSDIYSIVYHNHAPTKVLKIDKPLDVIPEIAVSNNLQNRSFNGFSIQPEDDYLKSRRIVLTNDDVNLILAAPKKSMIEYFFKNAQSDEMIFIHQGSGILKTVYGELEYKEGDHLIIPRGTNYQFAFENTINRMFIVESKQPLRFPRRYMNKSGQLLEHSPYYERDIRSPQNLITNDSTGDFLIKIKRDDMIFPYHYQTHPFDAIGWDGYLYPFPISIHALEPITGRIHQPPPVHQTFETSTMVTCAFVPRLYDFHPKAIPAPYNHSNIDSDEVLYYVDGDFMSRNNIEQGQITLHPMGIPHGPHPGAVNRSIGQKETQEYAIMVDTFKPLKLTTAALEIEDPDYYKSWLQ
jgi:homogentisate 1,2-dioxygenase